MKRHPLSVAIIITSLALAACNSNDEDRAVLPSKATTVATTTVTVTPSLGKILNAKVSLRNAKTNAEIVSAKALDANGVASFVVPTASLVEPILASVIPNDTGDVQYFDEATNSLQTIAITAANRSQPLLRAATKVTANTNIGVTALTEAAVQTAEAKAGGLAINIDGVNQLIQTQLQLTHSILQAPLVIGSTAQYNQLASTTISESQRVYAAYLANLAKQAALLNPSSTQPAFDIVQTLAADFKDDSQLNASFDASKIAIAYSSAFATAWLEAFSKVLAALKNLPVTNPDITNFFATAGQNTAIAQPIRVVDGVAEYACGDENKLRSSAGSQGMNIDFINQSGSGLKIFWLNYNGGRVSYNANLANTQTHAQGTYVTHPWVVTDSSGLCKGIYRPITQTNKTITFKADGVMIGNGSIIVEEKTPATVNTGLVKNYDLIYKQTQAGGGYVADQKVTAIVSSNGDLAINGFVIKSPYYDKVNGAVFTGEVIWKDVNIKYALSNNNTGVFNEINVFDSNKTNSFLGQFVLLNPVANNCTSQGADNKLGFTNAPTDFCSFSKLSSTAITSPDIYTFVDASGANVKVTVENNTLKSVQLENNKYAFACGVGETVACQNTVFNNQSNFKEFSFANTVLSAVNGATQNLTLKNGSLMHQISTNGGASLAFNATKCTQAFSQTAFGITAIAYNFCASDAVGDFSLTAQDNNTFSPTHDGIPCTITKVGSAVTLTKGAKSLTVQFNGDSTDVMTLRTGALTDTQVENDITARTAPLDLAGQTVRVEIRKNGNVASAQAQNIQGNESFGCVAL